MIVSSENEAYLPLFFFEDGVPPDDALGDLTGLSFSTHDRDNDHSNENCAQKCGAGFWYKHCEDGDEMGNINQHENAACGGFSWDKPDPDIELKETKLYLICG